MVSARLGCLALGVSLTLGGATDSDRQIQALAQDREHTREQLENTDKLLTHLEQEVIVFMTIIFGTVVLAEYRVNKAVGHLEKTAREVNAESSADLRRGTSDRA
jgi:hypothetical protein